jgi:two-component system, OmpR family, phosphate regulon sensor histidine kinase PhoR
VDGKQQDLLKAELFPDDISPRKDFLLVSLEEQNAFVFSRIKGMLLVTLMLTLFIISVFYLTIRTIMQQKRLAEMKSDFINNMSHEFKTPLATISIAVDAINNPKVRENFQKLDYYTSIIKEENKKMNAHVEKVLTIARCSKEDIVLKNEEVNMHTLLEKSLDGFDLLLKEKQVQLHTDLNASGYVVKGDEFHLHGLAKNLLDNAIKYSGNCPVIQVRTFNEAGAFCLSVKDNGPGMSKETQKNIFEKFYRATTGNLHDVKGFGLGLSYVKNIIEAHKGEIKVESQLGRGSEFVVKLKLPV